VVRRSDTGTLIVITTDLGIPADFHEIWQITDGFNKPYWACRSCSFQGDMKEGIAHIVAKQFRSGNV